MNWFKNKSKRVLVVDDELDIALAIKARLLLEGYKVMVASDGESGLRAVQSDKPDLVILDVMMPGMDGISACLRLKSDEKFHRTPVLILTALPRIEDAEEAFSAGADDFLNKPFSNERLMAKVKKLLGEESRLTNGLETGT